MSGTGLEGCCICSAPTSSKKRKKFHGASCKKARDIIDNMMNEEFRLTIWSFEETSMGAAYLCLECEKKIVSISAMEEKLRCIKSEVQHQLSKLHQKSRTGIGQKRPISSRNVDTENSSTAAITLTATNRPANSTMLSSPCSTPSRQTTPQPHPTTPRRTPNRPTTFRRRTNSVRSTVSPDVTVVIKYPSGVRNYKLDTPFRKCGTRRFIRGHYANFALSLIEKDASCHHMLNALAAKIKKEMREVCKVEHRSILRDDIEGVKCFSWETVWQELQRNVPTLVLLLTKLLSRPNKPLICFIISQVLKHRLPCMALAQRAVSVLLYGNGTSKQVYNCLQRLMICLSYSGTTGLIKKLSEDHNVDVLYWSDDLKKAIPEQQVENTYLNDEAWFDAFNDSFVLDDNQQTIANDSYVSQNQQTDTDSTDSDNYITEDEEEIVDEEDTIDAPAFSVQVMTNLLESKYTRFLKNMLKKMKLITHSSKKLLVKTIGMALP